MKNIMKKSIAVVLTMAFSGLQMSFATVLTRGVDSFNNAQVLGGSGAIIKNATAGLKSIETDQMNATLKFDNHTRIDWSKFNVDKNQSIYFNNGSYGVLNNVVQGSISKVAGLIKADNGKVIISNPNGILFNGGKFESAGSIVLTTKDLTGLADGTNFNTYDIGTSTGAANGANVGVVAIIGGSSISSPDISIVANGVHFDSSTLSSPSANGVVLVTADGANYAATTLKDADNTALLTTTNNSAYVAYSTIKTQDGQIKFLANGQNTILVGASNLDVTGTNNTGSIEMTGDTVQVIGGSVLKGNTKLVDNVDHKNADGSSESTNKFSVWLNGSTVNGDLVVDSMDGINIVGSTVNGTVDADAIGYIEFKNSTAGATDLNTNGKSYIKVYSAEFNGDLTMNGSALALGKESNDASKGIKVHGDLTSTSTLDTVLRDSIIDGDMNMTGDMIQVLTSNIAGNATLVDNVDHKNADGTSEASNAYGIWVTGSNVAGNLTAKAIDSVNVANSVVTGSVDANSVGYIKVKGSEIGSAKLNANGVTIAGETTEGGSYVQIYESKVNGNLDMNGTSVVIGKHEKTYIPEQNDVVVTGYVKGNATGTVGISTNLTADSIELSSTNSSVVQAFNSGVITTDSLTINAPTGAVVGLSADAESGVSEYYTALQTNYIPGTKGAADYKELIVKSANGGADDIALNLDTKVANVKTTAANTIVDVTNANNTVQDLKVTASGNVDAQNIKAVKAAADTNNTSGSVVVTSENGNVKIGNVVGDTDVKVYAENGNIEVTDKFIADNEDNGVGELNLTGKKAYNTGSSNLTLTSANAGGANVIVDIVEGNIIASGLTTDRHNASDASGNFILSTKNGGVIVGDVIADTDLKIFAENGDITVTGKLIADNEDNGVGELNLTGKTAKDLGASDLTLDPTKAGGANIIVNIASGDIKASDLVTDRHSAGDTSGNFVLTTGNGNISAGNIVADTDLKVIASGNVEVTGKLKADNEANGVGDLVIKGQTAKNAGADDLTMTGTDFGGANIEVTIGEGNINASDLTASKQGLPTDNSGNVNLTTGNGNIKVGDIIADTDLKVIAENGRIDITGKLLADNDGNNVGDLVLRANTGDFILDNSNGTNFTGANIEAVVNKGDITANGLNATGNDDNNGNITISTGEGNVVVADTNATHDITITALKGSDDTKGFATVTNTKADSDTNGQGKLTIVADNKVIATNAGGSNVVITSNDGDIEATNINTTAPNDNTQGDIIITADNGDVTVIGANGDHDVIITAGGNADVTDAHADKDNNKAGDLIVKGNGDVTVTDGSGADVEIESKNGDVTAKDIVANGDDKNGADDGKGDIHITAENGDVTVDGANGTHDVVITAGGNADVTDAHADTDNNKHGDLIVNAGGNADVDNGTGNNVHIDADGNINADDITGKDDVIINGGGTVIGNNLVADGDDDGIGELIINGSSLNIDGNGGGVNVVINGLNPDNNTLTQEVLKNLNNLLQSGVDTQIAQSFTPIAFAADDDDEQSAIAKRIAKTVFKTPETGIVTITERYNSVK